MSPGAARQKGKGLPRGEFFFCSSWEERDASTPSSLFYLLERGILCSRCEVRHFLRSCSWASLYCGLCVCFLGTPGQRLRNWGSHADPFSLVLLSKMDQVIPAIIQSCQELNSNSLDLPVYPQSRPAPSPSWLSMHPGDNGEIFHEKGNIVHDMMTSDRSSQWGSSSTCTSFD